MAREQGKRMMRQATQSTIRDHRPAVDAIALRAAALGDLPAIQAIYAGHVLTGTGSFEETPPDLEEMGRRMRSVRERDLPYLVATADGAVSGFAYAGPFRPRSAYRFTVEDSVYVASDRMGRGIGRQLLAELIRICEGQGYRQMIGIVGDSANLSSIRLHESLGFRRMGLYESIGFKFGRWLDIVHLQRPLGEGAMTLP
jgi:L-amino acid N-acyltransferase YncA